MANDKKKLDKLKNLNSITKFTDSRTYGVSTDMPGILTNDINDFINKVNSDKDKNKSLINSHMSRARLRRDSKNVNIYDLIDNQEVLDSIEGTIGSENIRFSQLLKDYEIIKRCIPQVHRVINTLKTNIVSPDSMGAGNILGVTVPSGTDKIDEKLIRDITEKYELNQRIQNDIVIDYLIASVKYITIVPYSLIPEMLYKDEEETKPSSLSECIEKLDRMLSNAIKPLSEAAGDSMSSETKSLLESVGWQFEEDRQFNNGVINDTRNIINEQAGNIEFIDGAMGYYKNAILNEAVNILSSDDKELKSMKSVINKIQKESGSIANAKAELYTAAEGLVDSKTYNDIKKKVNFKGAHIEYLPAARTIAFKLRDTIIGYFYVEDRIKPNNNSNVMSIMDKINASVYIKNTKVNESKRVEEALIKSIGDKLIKAINGKFINDNYEDIDIIYEFVRVNELHTKSKRVVFFHPDDVCEFRRSDGSIMKNCMFFAKLLILNLLSNIITKVTRGSDRNIHYVKTGLTTDIEGNVNDTIRAIKQNQIRYSDIGTINEIFNIVGSNVDVFMPVSTDGERPIETETISGQNVDMNDDFTNWIIRSIIQSFGVPASIIDDIDSVEFAKTISMSNLEMAKATYDAQVELNPGLTKMYRLLVKYELPEYEQYDEVEARLNPPSIIVYEMNRDRMDSIDQVADKLAELIIGNEGESAEDRKRRLFKLEYYKRSMPTWDWDMVQEIVNDIMTESKIVEQEKSINFENEENNDQY